MISIIIISFNQEKYIGEAIEGVVNQKVNRPLQVIIGDDGSTDNTQEIIKAYYKKYPQIIVPILREGNIGANKNYMDCYNRCTGKYVGVCEGDDFWTDPEKLQKQIDFLEQNPEYVLCYTDIQHYNESDKRYIELVQKGVDTIDLKDLFTRNYVTTLTAVFRNGLVSLPEDFQDLLVGDWPLFAMVAQYGKLKRLPVVTGVYRIHSANSFQANSYLNKKLKITQATEFLYRHFQPKYRSLARARLIDHYYVLAVLYGKAHQLAPACEFYQKMLALIKNDWNFKVLRLRLILFLYNVRNKFAL